MKLHHFLSLVALLGWPVAGQDPPDPLDAVRAQLAADQVDEATAAYAAHVAATQAIDEGLLRELATRALLDSLHSAASKQRLLEGIDEPRIFAGLRQLSADSQPASLVGGLGWLARAGDTKAQQGLRKVLLESEFIPQVEGVAAHLLALEDRVLIPWARAQLALEGGFLRPLAAQALGRLGSKQADLDALLADLAQEGSKGEYEFSIRAIADLGLRNDALREAAHKALAQGVQRHLPEGPRLSLAVQCGLHALGDATAQDWLRNSLTNAVKPGTDPPLATRQLAIALVKDEPALALKGLNVVTRSGLYSWSGLLAAYALAECFPQEIPDLLAYVRGELARQPVKIHGDVRNDQEREWVGLLADHGTREDLPLLARLLSLRGGWSTQAAAAVIKILSRS